MGALHDAIQTLLARSDLTLAQKRIAVLRLRTKAINDWLEARDIRPANPLILDRGDGRIVTIYSLNVSLGEVRVWLSWTYNGVPQPFDNPWVIINPPLLVPDPAGEVDATFTNKQGVVVPRRFRENIRDALLAILDGTLKVPV